VLFQNLLAKDLALFGLHIKTSLARGGEIKNVYWRDCRVEGASVGAFIWLRPGATDGRNGVDQDVNPSLVPPSIHDVCIENISGDGNREGLRIEGSPEVRPYNIHVRGCALANRCDASGKEMADS